MENKVGHDSADEGKSQDGSSHAEENKGKDGHRHYFRELLKEGPDRHIELLLTVAIATFALFQLIITCSNNASTSRQAQRLLDSAKRIDDAADSFSASAANINTGISNAVGKLQAQATATDTVRKSAETASHLDQRPWLGFKIINCDGCSVKYTRPPDNVQHTFTVSSFVGNLTNSGKTPAEEVHVDFVVTEGTRTNVIGRTPEENKHPYDPAIIQIVSPPSKGPRNQPTPLIGPNIDVPVVFVKNVMFNPRAFPRIPVIFVRGKITYKDKWHDGHETDFCIFAQAADDQTFPDQGTNGYVYCDEPNSNVMR